MHATSPGLAMPTLDELGRAATAAAEALAGRLRTALRRLAEHWHQLLDPAIAAGQGGAAAAGSRVPLLTEALHLRVRVAEVLAGWCRYATSALLPCPTHALLVHALPASDVPAMVRWLAPRAERLVDDPVVEVAVAELEALAAQVRAVVAPDGVRTIALPALLAAADLVGAASARAATCPWPACGGALTMTARPDRAVTVDCSGPDGHSWAEGEWVVLARHLGDQAPARMASGELAQWLSTHLQARIPRRTLLTWATRYPQAVRRGDDGLFDRVEVAQWYLDHRARTASR